MQHRRSEAPSLFTVFFIASLVAGMWRVDLEAVDRIVRGTVIDQSGGVVVAARVAISQESGTAVSQQTISDSEGRFAFSVPEGRYLLTAQATGFAVGVLTVEVGGADAEVALQLTVAQGTETVIVTGAADRQLLLDTGTAAASRVGLSVRETPAAIEILTARQIETLGARTTVEAMNRAPGMTSTNLGTGPGQLSLRGFTGGAVSLLYDGARTATSAISTRSLDSFLFDRIEILKGPSSVLYGEGALAGAVNFVPKRATPGARFGSGLVSFGGFGESRIAADGNLSLGESTAVRGLVTYSRSNGYIDDTDGNMLGVIFSAATRPTSKLSIELGADYSDDDYRTINMGTPVVPRALARRPSDVVSTSTGMVIDRATRTLNFNVEDGRTDSDTLWLRSRVVYDVAGQWRLTNELSRYQSDRRFMNAEFYDFNARTGLVDRSTGLVTHDLAFWINRATIGGDFLWGERRQRAAAGVEYSSLDFFTKRRFGTTTPFDPYRPVRGRFPVDDTPATFSSRTDNDSRVDTVAAFGEYALNLTPKWLAVTGVRYDVIDLTRRIENVTTGAVTPVDQDFRSANWRVGTVYDLRTRTQIFGQVSSAVVPVANLLLLSTANATFDLTTGRSVEGGVKHSALDDRLDFTGTVYYLRQDDIITVDPRNPALRIQGGRQSARGVELAVSASVTERLRVDANYAVLDSRFDSLLEAGGVSRAGNTPPRAPERIANVFAFYNVARAPLTVSGGIRHAGRFFTDNANSIRVNGYTTLDAAVGYRVPLGELTVRGRNLTDAFYADFTDLSVNQVTLSAPRSVDLTFTFRF